MKYNRQQKFNFCSAVKTVLLVSVMCLSILLCYSCLKLRQRHLVILNSIESRKTQISDIEALSRANKEMLKNLKSNIEVHKLSFSKLMGQLSKYEGNLQSDTLYVDMQRKHKEIRDQLDQMKDRVKDDIESDLRENKKQQQDRDAKLVKLSAESNKLRDDIDHLRKMPPGTSYNSSIVVSGSNETGMHKKTQKQPVHLTRHISQGNTSNDTTVIPETVFTEMKWSPSSTILEASNATTVPLQKEKNAIAIAPRGNDIVGLKRNSGKTRVSGRSHPRQGA